MTCTGGNFKNSIGNRDKTKKQLSGNENQRERELGVIQIGKRAQN